MEVEAVGYVASISLVAIMPLISSFHIRLNFTSICRMFEELCGEVSEHLSSSAVIRAFTFSSLPVM